MADRNRRLSPDLFFYVLSGRPLDRAGDASTHYAQAVRRIDNDISVRVKNAAVDNKYWDSDSIREFTYRLLCDALPASLVQPLTYHRFHTVFGNRPHGRANLD